MSTVKLLFEIGHTAERKAKPSKHGFTHDWELFVKCPIENSDISQFVEKVVFNLHDSFPKPKRTIKEPPFVVKESGYAGFELTIDIYLRNRDDPKKIQFPYDLDLQPFKSEIKEHFVNNPSDDFKRKCIKAGCQVIGSSSDYKNKDYKVSSSNQVLEIKKPKRPEDSKTKSYFTELFGDPIEKTSAKVIMNKKEEKPIQPQASSSNHKDKDKSKYKHSPINENKESSKKSGDRSAQNSLEKPKKDKTRDRERSEKKEKSSKRALSPNIGSSSRGNSSTTTQQVPSKLPPESYPKLTQQPKQPAPTIEQPSSQQQPTSSSTKKSSKKKSYEKDRGKKESKKNTDSPSAKKSVKEDSSSKYDSRDKNFKPKSSASDSKPQPLIKKHDVIEAERKHKHKKKEKSKEKEKKEKQIKNQPALEPPVTQNSSKSSNKFEKANISEDSSDGEIDSSPMKQEHEPVVDYKAMIETERHHIKGSRDKAQKSNEKEDKKRKRVPEKEDRDSSASPPPVKSKKEASPAPISNFSSKSTANNKVQENSNELRVTNEYLDELKDLKHKITTLKNNDHLQHVVRLIAATGCYEITKSTFDFDLVQLDKNTVQRLQEFFAN